jgi:hypothetical protein
MLPSRSRYGPPLTLSGAQATQLIPDGHDVSAAGADLQALPAQHSRSQWLRNTNGTGAGLALVLDGTSSPPALVTGSGAGGRSQASAAAAANAPSAVATA